MLALDYGIAVDASIPLEHEKTAESNVSRVRTRMRCISYELYYRMPLLLVGYLLMFIYLGRYVLMIEALSGTHRVYIPIVNYLQRLLLVIQYSLVL